MINKLSDLRSRVVLRLRGVTDEAAVDAIRQAYLRLCQETECWRTELTAQNLVAGEDEYRLNPPFDAAVARVKAVKIVSPAQYAIDLGDSVIPERPASYQCLDDDNGTYIKLLNVPDTSMDGYFLRVWCAVVPASNSNMSDADATILQRWGSAVVYAAVSYLASQQGRPWSNMQEASLSESSYMSSRRRVLCDMDVTKLESGPVRMRFPVDF